MIKKLVSALLAVLLVCGLFAACNRSNNPDTESGTGGSAAKVKEIRYLNFKPEIAEVYDRIAAAYEKSSGVKLIVETAASGTYESTLTARMATKEAPTLFQINGPIGYSSRARSFISTSRINHLQLPLATAFTASPMSSRATELSIIRK